MTQKTRILSFGTAMCCILAILAFGALAGDKVLKMSTTTSTQASGLLDILMPALEKDTGIQVKVIAKGTGAAIRDGMDGNVDVIFVHAKGREHKFVEDGYGTMRFSVMHNDFVLLGPASDPAGIRGMGNAAAALAKISASGASFISRGDDSGTHTKEQALWQESGLTLDQVSSEIVKKGKKRIVTYFRPQGGFYLSIGQGMGKALAFADEKQAYVLADRGTYLKYKFGKKPALELDVLVEGDALLFNPYGVIPVNPEKHPHVKSKLAREFCEWLVSPRAQKLIADYRLEGKPLFIPDVVTAQYK